MTLERTELRSTVRKKEGNVRSVNVGVAVDAGKGWVTSEWNHVGAGFIY